MPLRPVHVGDHVWILRRPGTSETLITTSPQGDRFPVVFDTEEAYQLWRKENPDVAPDFVLVRLEDFFLEMEAEQRKGNPNH